MSRRKKTVLGVAVLIVAGIVALLAWAKLHPAWTVMHVAPIVQAIKEPVGPARPVHWDQGPETAKLPLDQRPPNIVVILADDLGWNGVTENGGIVHGGVPTPNINAIAAHGVAFTNGYAANGTCAPSRAALMTGRYATRFGYEYTPTPDAMIPVVNALLQKDPRFIRKPIMLTPGAKTPPFNSLGMPTTEITMAQLLQKRGYHTVEIGKWHLGETGQYAPIHRGFDESLQLAGLLYRDKDAPDIVNAMSKYDLVDQFLMHIGRSAVSFDSGPRFDPGEYLTDYFTDNAVKVIHANRNRPFFLYLAHWAVHAPLQATKTDYDALSNIKNHDERVYGGMIRALDRSVGRVMAALKQNGLLDHTLVIFTSDNGAPGYMGLHDVNAPYRGWKLTYFEGGIHVPFYMQWPGHIKPGTVYKKDVQGVDIFSTVAQTGGAKLPTDRKIDGVDLVPYVTGKDTGAPHKSLYWQDGGYRVLMEGRWKLQVSARPKKVWLFDLATDPTEHHNLAKTDPARVAAMTKKLDALHKQMAPSLWKPAIAVPVTIDKDNSQPQAPGDDYVYWTD